MATLDEFGISAEPRIQMKRSLTLGHRTVGYIGRDKRNDVTCYYSRRTAAEHRYHGEDPWYDLPFDGPGHGLSVELFDRLYDAGVGPVYIVEEDTGTVFQYGYRQFVDGHPINYEDEANGRGYEKDFQKVLATADAAATYEDAAGDVLLVQPPYRR